MVDAVIAWVDGADPEHIKKRNLYTNSAVDEKSKATSRFSDNGEVYYCIRLIRKNAPCIDKIFLITDAQCPHWLDKEQQAKFGITLIDHKVIFRGYEDVLPTFNSLAIETAMYRIPSLDQRFIYFNDDVFITKPVLETDYFKDSVPLIRGFSFSRNKLLREIDRLFRRKSFRADGMVGTTFRQDDGLELPKTVKIGHTPHAIDREHYAALMEDGGRLERNIKFRFRHAAQFGPVPFYVSAGLKSGRAKLVNRDDHYLAPEYYPYVSPDDFKAKITVPGIRHMCVQSLDEFDPESRRNIYKVLDDLIAS